MTVELEKRNRPWRYDATECYLTFRTKTMLQIRRFAKRSKQLLKNMMNPDPGQEGETKVVWPHPKAFWFSKDTPTGHSELKKKRWAEEEVGRQY